MGSLTNSRRVCSVRFGTLSTRIKSSICPNYFLIFYQNEEIRLIINEDIHIQLGKITLNTQSQAEASSADSSCINHENTNCNFINFFVEMEYFRGEPPKSIGNF